MNETDKSNIGNIYFKLLNQQQFVAEELDYSNFNKHIPILQAMAKIGNSGISVFDIFKKEHIFYSPNFCAMLGYSVQDITDKGHSFIDSKIHPDDFIELMKNGISLLKLFCRPPCQVRPGEGGVRTALGCFKYAWLPSRWVASLRVSYPKSDRVKPTLL